MTEPLFRFVTMNYGQETLHGFSVGDSASIAVHIHGSWGNFYENQFVRDLAKQYVDAGWRYVAVNTPGHDGGTMTEDLDQSVDPICAWLSTLAPNGERIILQAHSLGALKVLKLLSDRSRVDVSRNVAAAILISPFDLVAFYGGAEGGLREQKRESAQTIAAEYGNDALVSKDIFDIWPVSVGTYLKATESNGNWDIFPTRDGLVGPLKEIGIPCLVALGSADFAATPDAGSVNNLLLGDTRTSTETVLIEGAPHNFAGSERALGDAVNRFLQSL